MLKKKSFPLFGLETLYLSVALLLMGNGLQNIFLTLRADIEGFTLPTIGAMASLYFAGFVAGCFTCPKYVARVGHIRTFAALASIVASAALLHSLWIQPAVWIVLRTLTGFCMAGLYVVIESWINEFAQNKTRGRIISQYRITDLLGTIVGQFFLLTADPSDYRLFILLAIFITLSLVPLSLTRVKSPTPIEERPLEAKKNLRTLWHFSPLGLVGCFSSGLVNASFWAMTPIFVNEKLGNFKLLPFFIVVYLAGGTISQWPVGWLSDRIDRRYVLIGISFLASIGALFINQSVDSLGWFRDSLWVWIFVFGACSIPIYSISIAHANDQTHAVPFLSMSSLLLLASSAGSVSGPFVVSHIANRFGSQSLFTFIASVQILMVLYCCYRLFVRKSVPDAEKVDWVNVPKSTPTIFHLDPRSDEELQKVSQSQ